MFFSRDFMNELFTRPGLNRPTRSAVQGNAGARAETLSLVVSQKSPLPQVPVPGDGSAAAAAAPRYCCKDFPPAGFFFSGYS